jgi:hypothetical protein
VEDGPWLHAGAWEVTRDEAGQPIERSRTVESLGYAKLNDQWQLAVVTFEESQGYVYGRPEKDNDGDVTEIANGYFTPLLQASRSLRTKALAEVEELLSTLMREAGKNVRIINHARQLAEKL